MNRALGLVALSLFALTACVVEPGTGDESSDETDISPDTNGIAVFPVKGYAPPGGGGGTVNITNHGGPVMNTAATINVYLLWYGAFDGTSGKSSTSYKSIVTDFASNIGGSPYFGINGSYAVPNSVTVKGQVDVPYNSSKPTSLTDANIQTIVSNAITSGKLPSDPAGVYFVMTSKDVTASSGFCTKYCGWHTHATIGGVDIKYSFVGDANRCITSCAQQSTSPNGDPGADGAVSVWAHELEETASDPDLNAWYDSGGAENGDKCAWTFGTTSTASNGSSYNMTLGSRKFLIQRNWSATTQACGLQ